MILAGQLGAGKTGLRNEAKEMLSQDGSGVVVVDVDEMREYHPEYLGIAAKDPRNAATAVQQDAGRWADELVEHWP